MAVDGAAADTGSDLVWLLLLGLLGVLLSVVLVRRMIRLAVMDVPGGRSAHDRPVPKGGGVGMVACLLLGMPLSLALLPHAHDRAPACGLFLSGVLLLAAVSWADDVHQFGFQAKLGAQLTASLLTIGAALSTLPALPPPMLLIPLLPLALGWLMLVTNATNFIDGMNGLAAGSIALLCLLAAGHGWRLGDPLVVGAATMAAAGLIGFLPYNYPRGRIFLGDVGSQVCGQLAGGLALFLLCDDATGIAALAVPLMLAGILWDVCFTLCRRLLGGERLTQAHRGHLYQVAARTGIPRPAIAVLHWGFVLWGGLLGSWMATGRPAAALLLVMLPQLGWTILIRRRAARAGLGRWS